MPCPEKFRDSLVKYKVNEDVVKMILKDNENLVSRSPKKDIGLFFKQAIDIMDEKIDKKQMIDILDYCGCCKSGARKQASKDFAKKYEGLSIEEKLSKIATEVTYMGQGVIDKDGTLILYAVSYKVNGKYECACPNYCRIERDFSVSKDYCYCCSGHFRYHYEIMLGVKLECIEVISSPLDSEGKNPCVLRYRILSK